MDKLQERKQRLERLWVGKTVISITNGYQVKPQEPSIHKCTVEGIDSIGEGIDSIGDSLFPVLLYEDGRQMLTMACVIEYRNDIWEGLTKMDPEAVWRLVENVVNRFSATDWRD